MTTPKMVIRRYDWRDHEGNQTPGIGLFTNRRLKGHYTPDEARELADTTEQEPQNHNVGQQKKQSTPEGAGK